MRRFVAVVVSAVALTFVSTGSALAAPSADNASCMGLGSYFYAQGAGFEGVTGVRADIAHIVKDSISSVPGEYLQTFAQEKEGGSIPEPCGARIE
jgi:hypothetical protein